jgi:hypothetical protein
MELYYPTTEKEQTIQRRYVKVIYLQSPSIDQLSKDARKIYYKEHEFDKQLQEIILEVNHLMDNREESTSPLYLIYRDVKNILDTTHEDLKDEIVYYTLYYVDLIIKHLIEVDSAYERLYRKILADIELINANIRDRVRFYDIPSAYYTEMKLKIDDVFGRHSPYLEGKNDAGPDDTWTVKNRNSVIMLRDVDIGNRMKSFPIVIDPNVSQEEYINLFSFTPLIGTTGEEIYLAEIIVSGDFYAFKGYLKSEVINREGKKAAIFDAEYGISFDIPFSFKVIQDEDTKRIFVLYKYEETPSKLITISKMDFSIQLLVGKNLIIFERNTLFSEPITA